MNNTVIGSLAAALYLIAGGLLGLRLFRGGGHAQGRAAALAVGWSGVALQGLVLFQWVLRPAGMNLDFFVALAGTGWLMAVVLLAAALFRPVENLGIILLPFSAIIMLLALLFPRERIVTDYGQWPLELHILLSMLAYSLLGLAALQAVLLAIQDRRLRNRQPGGFLRGIPPLVTQEAMLFQMIGAGFVLLSLALASGLLFLEDIFAQSLVHKTVLGLAAWAVFGILLWGRWRYGWRGRTAIRWTLSGFVTLALAYFGTKLVLELILQR